MTDFNMNSEETKIEVRALRALIKELDKEHREVWDRLDQSHNLESCFLNALRKFKSNDEILALMRDAEITERQIEDMAQYFQENDFGI